MITRFHACVRGGVANSHLRDQTVFSAKLRSRVRESVKRDKTGDRSSPADYEPTSGRRLRNVLSFIRSRR